MFTKIIFLCISERQQKKMVEFVNLFIFLINKFIEMMEKEKHEVFGWMKQSDFDNANKCNKFDWRYKDEKEDDKNEIQFNLMHAFVNHSDQCFVFCVWVFDKWIDWNYQLNQTKHMTLNYRIFHLSERFTM